MRFDDVRLKLNPEGPTIEHLDYATMMKVSQAVSGEMVLERLIDTLMRLAIEHAGAERSLLLLSRGNELRQEAEAVTGADGIIVRRGDDPAATLPDSIVHYVIRTREIVILDDASAHSTYCSDPYVRQRHTRSILCLPLVNEAKVIGALYLENNLTTHVFTPNRVTVLKVLASQAAISLENSRLYRDLADRERRIRRLVDANVLGICIWNIDGAIVTANDEYLRMLQYGPEDVASGRLRWTDLTPAEWRVRDEFAIAELRSTGAFQPFEKEYFRKDRSRLPVLIGGALFEQSGNEGVAFVLDLTERKRAEEALRESERSLRSVIDGIPGLVGILAPNGDVEAANRQITEYCGRSAEELRNWGTNGTIHHEDLPHVLEVFTKSIAAGIPYQIEHRLRRFDGAYRWFDDRGVPIRDDSGRIACWYVLLTDIDDRTRALARVQELQSDVAHMNRVATMGQMSASIAHEVSQPITGALTNASVALRLLRADPPNIEVAAGAIERILRDCSRAGEVVERVRAQIKNAPARKDIIDVNEAIGEILRLAHGEVTRRRVAVQTRLAGRLPHVEGDRIQLQQVILNLIINAAEAMSAMPEGSRHLTIRTGRDGAAVLVAVQDSGPGIDPAHLDRIFSAFYTTKASGLGMGLSISRSIIEAHGGRLWATSTPQGALFRLTLPTCPESRS
jgi:PAS domain S-box-containing protein